MNKGEITRQRIIEQAAPLFNRHGYAGCSLQDLMLATGLEKGGIYRHFDSKEDLASEALRYSLSRITQTRLAPLDRPAPASEHLRHAIDSFVDIPSPIPGGCPLMNTAVNSGESNPSHLKLALETLSAWRQRLEAIVQMGIDSGEFKADTAARLIANLLIATLEGAHLISRLESNRTALHDARATLNLIVDALKKPS